MCIDLYRAPSSALAVEDITVLMIFVRVNTAPLFCGNDGSFSERKKCLLVQLNALVLER